MHVDKISRISRRHDTRDKKAAKLVQIRLHGRGQGYAVHLKSESGHSAFNRSHFHNSEIPEGISHDNHTSKQTVPNRVLRAGQVRYTCFNRRIISIQLPMDITASNMPTMYGFRLDNVRVPTCTRTTV